MEHALFQKLIDKLMTREELRRQVELDFNLLPIIFEGISSSKATIRYSCAKILMDLSETHPQQLYPHMDFFVHLLDSKYRILTWNALAIIANLTRIDHEKKFDAIFDKYYSFIHDEYMVTVANLVEYSGKIATAKPYLVEKITHKLLLIEHIALTPHLTEECKRVIAGQAIQSFSLFIDKVEQKKEIIAFVKRQLLSPRRSLSNEAQNFLKKYET